MNLKFAPNIDPDRKRRESSIIALCVLGMALGLTLGYALWPVLLP
jgi:hypothetical protein